MKKIHIIAYAPALAGLLLAGQSCSREIAERSDGESIEIRLETSIAPTKATGTAFEEGDQIGFYCVESKASSEEALLGTRHIDNKLLTMTAGTLSGKTPSFFPTEYKGASDFYAYYPYRNIGLGAEKSYIEIAVEQNQSSDASFKGSDCMLAIAQNVARTKDPIRLNFKRLTSRIDFEIKPGTGYNSVESILSAKLTVQNVARVCNVDYTTGEVFSPAISTAIVPNGAFEASGDKAVGVSAIVIPQSAAAGSDLFVLRIGDRKFRCLLEKDVTFEAGKKYTFALTPNRTATGEEIFVNPTISDWTEGTPSSGETVVVDPDDDASSVTDIDGNEYGIVRIGTQKWLAENLKVSRFNDGSPISYIEDQDAWAATEDSEEPACCYYNNDKANATFGLLYNWHCVREQKLCPKGWKVPSKEEWDELIAYLGGSSAAATAAKSVSGWTDNYGTGKPEYQGSNESGFNGLPGGDRKWNKFELLHSTATWWTMKVSSMSSLSANYAKLNYLNAFTTGSSMGKESGCSIRCIKETK